MIPTSYACCSSGDRGGDLGHLLGALFRSLQVMACSTDNDTMVVMAVLCGTRILFARLRTHHVFGGLVRGVEKGGGSPGRYSLEW